MWKTQSNMGKSTADKLWGIKVESRSAFLFKGGKKVPGFRNIVGASVVEEAIASSSSCSGESTTMKIHVRVRT